MTILPRVLAVLLLVGLVQECGASEFPSDHPASRSGIATFERQLRARQGNGYPPLRTSTPVTTDTVVLIEYAGSQDATTPPLVIGVSSKGIERFNRDLPTLLKLGVVGGVVVSAARMVDLITVVEGFRAQAVSAVGGHGDLFVTVSSRRRGEDTMSLDRAASGRLLARLHQVGKNSHELQAGLDGLASAVAGDVEPSAL